MVNMGDAVLIYKNIATDIKANIKDASTLLESSKILPVDLALFIILIKIKMSQRTKNVQDVKLKDIVNSIVWANILSTNNKNAIKVLNIDMQFPPFCFYYIIKR